MPKNKDILHLFMSQLNKWIKLQLVCQIRDILKRTEVGLRYKQIQNCQSTNYFPDHPSKMLIFFFLRIKKSEKEIPDET